MVAFASNGWPTTKGTITTANVAYKESTSSDARGSYSVFLEYHFKVKETTYSGQKIAFGVSDAISGLNRGEEASRDIVNNYPPGAEVAVHYNPSNPAQCVLKPGPTIGLYFIIAFALFAIVGHLQYALEQLQGVGTQITPASLIRVFGFMAFFLTGMAALAFPSVFGGLSNLLQPNTAPQAVNGPLAKQGHILDKAAMAAAAQAKEKAYEGRYKLHDPAKVEALYRKAIKFEENAYGASSGQVYDVLIELGTYLQKIGEDEKAIDVLKRADQVWISILPYTNWHDHVIGVLSLAPLLEDNDRGKEAIMEYQKLGKEEARILGKNDLLVANSLRGLADSYERQKMFKEEEQSLSEALAITEKATGKNSDDYFYALRDLGAGQLAGGNKAEALKTLNNAYDLGRKKLGDRNDQVQWVRIKIEEAQGK